VPTRAEEAARDMVRVREDALTDRLRARHHLSKYEIPLQSRMDPVPQSGALLDQRLSMRHLAPQRPRSGIRDPHGRNKVSRGKLGQNGAIDSIRFHLGAGDSESAWDWTRPLGPRVR
jgi:hypothetical protein